MNSGSDVTESGTITQCLCSRAQILYTYDEAQRLLSLPRSSFYALKRKGVVKPVYLGPRTPRIPVWELFRLAKAMGHSGMGVPSAEPVGPCCQHQSEGDAEE